MFKQQAFGDLLCNASCLLFAASLQELNTTVESHAVFTVVADYVSFADCISFIVFAVSKEIGSEQIPKSTIAVLGKMPGSEGNQTAKHRQYCVNVAGLGSTQL